MNIVLMTLWLDWLTTVLKNLLRVSNWKFEIKIKLAKWQYFLFNSEEWQTWCYAYVTQLSVSCYKKNVRRECNTCKIATVTYIIIRITFELCTSKYI